MPPLLRQPHREFYALVPLLLLLEPIGGDEALQASTPTCTAEVVSSLMS